MKLSQHPHAMLVADNTSLSFAIAEQFKTDGTYIYSNTASEWYASPRRGVMIKVRCSGFKDGAEYVTPGQIYAVLLRNKAKSEINSRWADKRVQAEKDLSLVDNYAVNFGGKYVTSSKFLLEERA